MSENDEVGQQQTTESALQSDACSTAKQEFETISQSAALQSTSSSAIVNCCNLMGDSSACPLPSVAESEFGSENAVGDICLESESFLQSLGSIPLPAVTQPPDSTMFVPVASISDMYPGSNNTSYVSCGTPLQQEILRAWGDVGSNTNGMYRNSSPGVGFMQMSYGGTSPSPVQTQRCVSRGGRGRGRGRGLRKRIDSNPSIQEHFESMPHISFSPRFVPVGPLRGSRTGNPVNSAPPFMPRPLQRMLSQSPSPQTTNVMLQDMMPGRHSAASNYQTAESILTFEESQANEKMNAYIEKFSSDLAENFGPSITVDTSHKPGTLQEAISMYIDFIILENEKKTRISCCNILPVPLDFHKEDYYHEIMCQPIAFPTTKFREWLKLYNVDIEITDPDGQTVAQTTFPPSANVGDSHHANVPTPTNMLKWQTNGSSDEPRLAPTQGVNFNMSQAFRGRPRGRVGPILTPRLNHPAFVAFANRPNEFIQNGAAMNVPFQRNDRNALNIVSPCAGNMHQFQTISLPTLGTIQYANPSPYVNVPHNFPELAANRSLKGGNNFSAESGDCPLSAFTMPPIQGINSLMPCAKGPQWRGPVPDSNTMMSDFKSSDNMRNENLNLSEPGNKVGVLSNADGTFLVPSVIEMLPSFSTFANGSCGIGSLPPENMECYAQSQTLGTYQMAGELGNAACGSSSLTSMDFRRDAGEDSSLSLKTDVTQYTNCGIGSQFSSVQSAGYGWNSSASSDRVTSVPVVKEMVDQESQTEIDELATEIACKNVCEVVLLGTKSEPQDVGLDSEFPSFSFQEDSQENEKSDEASAEILLRNASVILNGSLELDDPIPSMSFASQNLLSCSQTSILGQMDNIGQSETNVSQSVESHTDLCGSDNQQSACTPAEEPTGDSDKTTSVECGETSAEPGFTRPDLVLEVASNVEIDMEDNPTGEEMSDSQWIEPECKRLRLSSSDAIQEVAQIQETPTVE